MSEPIKIKRYANRRLYDMNKSAYVTLDQVADSIRQGREVQVFEAKTEEDITAYVLTQIVLEEARKKNILLPAPMLHLVIRHGETILSEFFEKHFEEAVKAFMSYKAMADEQFKNWLGLGFDLSEMARQTAGNINPFQSFMESMFAASKKDPKK